MPFCMVSNNFPDTYAIFTVSFTSNDMTSLCIKHDSNTQPTYFSLKVKWSRRFFWLDLGSLAYDSTKIGPNFRKQTVTKIEVIKKCYKSSCSPNTIFLT